MDAGRETVEMSSGAARPCSGEGRALPDIRSGAGAKGEVQKLVDSADACRVVNDEERKSPIASASRN
jgi:hypothetical protein